MKDQKPIKVFTNTYHGLPTVTKGDQKTLRSVSQSNRLSLNRLKIF